MYEESWCDLLKAPKDAIARVSNDMQAHYVWYHLFCSEAQYTTPTRLICFFTLLPEARPLVVEMMSPKLGDALKHPPVD